jgi:transposase
METVYFLGIDISKKKFDAALTQDGSNMYELVAANNAAQISVAFRELKKKFGLSYDQLIVCLEHTGIYCQPLLDFAVAHNLKICLEPALQIKQSQGMVRGKSDRIDAKRIALYAFKNREQLKFWRPQRQIVQKLKALLVTRERLIIAKVQLQTPLSEGKEFIEESIRKTMVKCCQKALQGLASDIEKIENEIQLILTQDQHLSCQMKWATSVPGIGKITGANLIVTTGEFERIVDAKKCACYAGIAPFEHSSGSSIRGKARVSKLANMTMKKLLHLSAMAAIRHNEELRIFYTRKVAEGKNKMSVINAVRNKLISRVFACVKDQRCYEKIYQHALA